MKKSIKLFLLSTSFLYSKNVLSLSASDAKNNLNLIHAVAAKNYSQGQNVLVAIVDSGINLQHEALKNNIYKNNLEIPNNKIDDDQNGFVDDVSGWNFVNNNSDVADDESGHGSASASVAASDLVGIAPKAKVLPIKIFKNGIGSTSHVIRAIYYAVDMKAKVINLSLMSSEFDEKLLEAIKFANQKQVLVIAAAGNFQTKCDSPVKESCFYPAAFEIDNLISVAAAKLDGSSLLTKYSNYGLAIDMAAPAGENGEGWVVAEPSQIKNYRLYNGTSAAAAAVTGVAALVKSYRPDLSVNQIKEVIIKGATNSSELKGKLKNSVVLDALGPIQLITN